MNIPVTKHFDHEPDDTIGELQLREGIEIPANCVFTLTMQWKDNDKGKIKKLFLKEITLITDEHYKQFLDHIPNSCVKLGGHVLGKERKCQICLTKIQ